MPTSAELVMFEGFAPRLTQHFTVVATDLRGYGDSGKPASTADHGPYSMRALARDQVEVMNALGFAEFAVAGHDRGARCAYRLALDTPEAVTHLAVLDVIPTVEAFDRADRRFALGFWVWTGPTTTPRFRTTFVRSMLARGVTQPPSTPFASSTGRPPPWTMRTTKPIAAEERSPAPSWCYGDTTEYSRSGTTPWTYGEGGPTTCKGHQLCRVTSCQRKHQTKPTNAFTIF